MKRLWVVVLNWNGLEDTRALLRTLAAAHAPEGWSVETLVVDNGSTDGSAAALRSEFPDVGLLTLSENRRFAGGNNQGLRYALDLGADAMMLLNNDTLVDPDLFVQLMRALDQDPGAGAAGPLIYFAAPRDRVWFAGGVCIPALGVAQHRGLRARDQGQFRTVETVGYLTGCCLLARREVWERIGSLDDSYYIYAEDADWCLRARAVGYRLLFVPQARMWHKVSASSGAASPWKIYHRVRANLTLFARHARGLGRITWAPAFLAQQAVLAAWLLSRGNAAAAAAVPRALWDALRGKSAGEAKA